MVNIAMTVFTGSLVILASLCVFPWSFCHRIMVYSPKFLGLLLVVPGHRPPVGRLPFGVPYRRHGFLSPAGRYECRQRHAAGVGVCQWWGLVQSLFSLTNRWLETALFPAMAVNATHL